MTTRCNEAAAKLRVATGEWRGVETERKQQAAYQGAIVELENATAALGGATGNTATLGNDAHIDPMFHQWAESIGWLVSATPSGVKTWAIFGMSLILVVFSAVCISLGSAILLRLETRSNACHASCETSRKHLKNKVFSPKCWLVLGNRQQETTTRYSCRDIHPQATVLRVAHILTRKQRGAGKPDIRLGLRQTAARCLLLKCCPKRCLKCCLLRVLHFLATA